MATNINTILNWFKTGFKPTQDQFWASWQSFWHKDEQIPQSSIANLTTVLAAKAENDQFNAHKTDETAHTALFVKAKIYAPGQLLIFKRETNANYAVLEINDFVIGIVSGIRIEAIYLGGDPTILTSFDIINQIEF
jgi:hypothetical protein